MTEAKGTDTDGDGYGDNPNGSRCRSDSRTMQPNGTIPMVTGMETTQQDSYPSDGTQWNDTDADGYGDNPNGTNADDVSQATQTGGAIQTATRIPTRKTMTHSRTIHHSGTIPTETATVTIQTERTQMYSQTTQQNGMTQTVTA